MAKQTRKGSYTAAALFLLASICFVVSAYAGWGNVHTTSDRVLKIVAPAAMFLAALVSFARALKLPPDERAA